MLLLLSASLLLLFITLGLGMFTCNILSRLFNTKVLTGLPGIFLCGLVFSAVYFQLLSLVVPVNYLTLLPLICLSAATLFNNKLYKSIIHGITANITILTKGGAAVLTAALLLLWFIYWLAPPLNGDSGSYHYLSILWYEKYKVVPGLANVHGRLAFNPASFIIDAAYSFTGLLQQSIYPLNGVTICIFFTWLLTLALKSTYWLEKIVYLLMIPAFSRVLLDDVSSPSSDPLFIVCITYAIISIYNAVKANRFTLANGIIPVILLAFSVTAKLSSITVLLLLPIAFCWLPANKRTIKTLAAVAAVCMVIWLPWLCRNIILSGYLVYPLYYVDLFNVDWKAPASVLKLDHIFINQGPKFFSLNFAYLQSLSFGQWFPKWLRLHNTPGFMVNLALFLAGMLSPLYWLLFIKHKRAFNIKVCMVWLVIYIGAWFWLINSPDYRFGVVFLTLAAVLPFLQLAAIKHQRNFTWPVSATYILIVAAFIFNCLTVFTRPETYRFGIKDCWLYPLKDKRYFYKNNKTNFPYTVMNNGVKLYLSDSAHECINTGLPCMSWRYGNIEMRGPTIQDGFRNSRDEVKTYFPFVK